MAKPRPVPHLRQGPRPLPIHLLSHVSTLLSSHVALPLLKSGSFPWVPGLADKAKALKDSLDAAGPESYALLAREVVIEGLTRHEGFLAGVEAYRRHPYHRDLPPPPVLKTAGTTRLVDYRDPAAKDGVPVLVVPSLVNRSYILDLMGHRSMLRYLACHGLAPFLVDWDAPGEEESGFGLDDYIAGRLEWALDAVLAEAGRPPALLGYCMGGLLALALAHRRPEAVGPMVLLATPWDFHAGREAHGMMMQALSGPLGKILDAAGMIPVDMLQTMFSGLDVSLAPRKFASFARLKTRSAKARDFVALEDWANDGVPLPGKVARECLFGWYGDNAPARGTWEIAGRAIRPEEVKVPALVVVPERDRIVPPESALPLARALPGGKLFKPHGGHVGMMLTRRARTDLYGPIARWLVRASMQ
jgi:polyhydroxyalkanoate synthase